MRQSTKRGRHVGGGRFDFAHVHKGSRLQGWGDGPDIMMMSELLRDRTKSNFPPQFNENYQKEK